MFDLIDAGARIAAQDGDGDFERSEVDALLRADDGRDGPAAGRALVLGATRDVHHRVADDGGDHGVHDRAGVPRIVDVGIIEHRVPAAPHQAVGGGLAFRKDVDDSPALLG